MSQIDNTMESLIHKLEDVEHYLDGVTANLDQFCDDLSQHYPNLTTLSGLLSTLFSLIIIYTLIKLLYNIYLHPLSKFPGPKSAAATKFPIAYKSWNGTFSHWLRDLHQRYNSDVIRISPDEVSVIAPTAWKDIYASLPSGHKPFAKDLKIFAGVDNIVTANDADHSRIRRLLSHAFSDKALREQESLIMVHIGNLMEGLKRQAKNAATQEVNLSDWFMWTTFDVVGDLSFGRPFGCLTDKKYHPWVAMVMDSLQHTVLLSVTIRFPPLDRLLRYCVPKKVNENREQHVKWSVERVEQRLNAETARPDFISYITRRSEDTEKGGMTREEIHKNAPAFISAGSETTAALMAAAVWFLLQHREWYDKITHEIRSSFENETDISLARILELPYLQAVINESFRLYPPAVAGQPRVVPKEGASVSGHWIPGNTGIILNQYAANHAAMNFDDADVFRPERWLEDYRQWKGDKRDVVQPFSIGARNCIGKNLAMAEIRLGLTHLFYNFDIERTDSTDPDWSTQKAWFTWAKKPLFVKLRIRDSDIGLRGAA